ncbi:MAG: hypothetical protein RJB38_2304 [Pseudomonadota bacterium]|jgi:dinuclear metal center YbgI/SA1388 family protein
MTKQSEKSRGPKSRKVGEIIRDLAALAPESCAESWDNVGLLVGDPEQSTTHVVVSIDLTADAIQLAQRTGARLIVNHHPCIFPKQRGLARVAPPSLVWDALQAGIAVYASHTNFDRCALEVPESISKAWGLRLEGRLIERPAEALRKLVVFVPQSHVNQVHSALVAAGAGHLGNYDSCAFLAAGEGTFRGGDQTQPFIGTPGVLERAKEVRLETVLPAGLEPQVLQALRSSHPYEEVAYDLYSVHQTASGKGLVRGLGYGFYGDLERAESIEEFTSKSRRLFEASGAILTSAFPQSSRRKVRKIGFVAGKGSAFIGAAVAAGCDAFVTGEVDYHEALGAARQGMTVIELGHRESERFFLKIMSSWLKRMGLQARECHRPVQRIGAF